MLHKASFLGKSIDDQKSAVKDISISGSQYSLTWFHPEDAPSFLKKVGLETHSLKKPCPKRIAFIENALKVVTELFPAEIAFIANHTAMICWLENKEESCVASAGFYEIPGCTFFSDAAMFSLPPEIIVPKKHAGYAIFENLYHEASHHQMHNLSRTSNIPYLIDPEKNGIEYSISWRTRNFTLLEAFNALHIYASVTPFRLQYLTLVRKNINVEDATWIETAFKESFRMWHDLLDLLLPHQSSFHTNWAAYISIWEEKYLSMNPKLRSLYVR